MQTTTAMQSLRSDGEIQQRDRVISLSLSEAEWRAFVARQPNPVGWLQEQIRGEIVATTTEAATDGRV